MKETFKNFDKTKHYARLLNLFDISTTGLWEMTRDGDVTFFNESFYKSFDIPLNGSTIHDWLNVIHPEDRSRFMSGLNEHESLMVESFKSEYRVINAKGEIVWIEAQGVATFDDDGKFGIMVGSHSDITLTKEYQNKLYELAYVDKTTGLYNNEKLLSEIEEDVTTHHRGTVTILDLYQLVQMINIYGYQYVNDLQMDIIKILKRFTVNHLGLFRLSLNKYAYLDHTGMNAEEQQQLISKIKSALKALTDKHNLTSDIRFTTAILSYPIANMTIGANDILDRLYLTLNEASYFDKDAVVWYSDDIRQKVLKRIYIETNITKGLRDDEFYLMFQPIVESASGTLTGFEALIRWKSKEWGIISPDEFIPSAEQTKEISLLGAFVLDKACAFIAHYNQTHQKHLSISINTSVIEILKPGFVDRIEKTLASYNLKPEHLVIEVTESILIDETSVVTSHLSTLKEKGVGIALDDFGSGYASLNTMIFTPLSIVKIDRQIMTELMHNPILEDIIEAIIRLCHDHDVTVVAEGVETKAMVEKAVALNVDKLQGYYYSKPLNDVAALSKK